MSNKTLIADIVKYLQDSIQNGSVGSDDSESVEIAIETLSEVFGVEAGSNDLQQIYERGLSSTTTAGASVSQTSEKADHTPVQITEETKQQAEAKKQAGNREMAHKNYDQAIDLYSEAIALNPENPLYYSNRAAAYSQANKASLAVSDARRAISLDPNYSKAYSRLGLALYTLGDTQGSLHAYEQGLKAEGDSPSEGMQRGYDTVKARLDGESKDITTKSESESNGASTPQNGGFGAGGLGAGLGGFGGLGDILKNPEIRNMASKMMSNPSAMSDLMNSPAAQSIKNQFGGGGTPDLSKLMNDPNISKMMNDPMIQNMAKQFMG